MISHAILSPLLEYVAWHMMWGQEDFADQMCGPAVEDHPSTQKGEDELWCVYGQTPHAIYTEQGPNNKHRDMTLSHPHSTPVACHEISKDLQLRAEMTHMIDWFPKHTKPPQSASSLKQIVGRVSKCSQRQQKVEYLCLGYGASIESIQTNELNLNHIYHPPLQYFFFFVGEGREMHHALWHLCAVCGTPVLLAVGIFHLLDNLPSDLPTKTLPCQLAQLHPVKWSSWLGMGLHQS